jgi:PAS domain S-box-containing protein
MGFRLQRVDLDADVIGMRSNLKGQWGIDLRSASLERWLSVLFAGLALLSAMLNLVTGHFEFDSLAVFFAIISAGVLLASWIARRPSSQLSIFSEALDATRDMVFLIDPDSMRFVHVNKEAFESLGYTAKQMRTMTPPDICVGRSLDEVRTIFNAARFDPDGAGSIQSTYRARCGRQIHVEVRIGFLERMGARGVFVVVGRDVTDERSAFERLRRSEDLLQRTQSISGVGGWELDVRENTMYWSHQARVIHGVDDDFTLTLDAAFEFPVEHHRSIIADAINACLEDGTPFDLEIQIVTKSGTTRWVRVVGEPSILDGCVIRLSGTIEDISEKRLAQKKLEQALEHANTASRSKSEFLANMSHEIRTPLTAIIGYTDLLVEAGLDDGARRAHIGTIRRNGEHLAAVINDILDVSKIEAGKITVELLPMSVGEIVRDSVSLLEPKAREKQIELSCRIAQDVPACIVSDRVRFRQILINLITNAVKFTDTGSVEVIVEHDQHREQLVVRVVDTGIGLSPNALESLFTAFTQADTSITRRYGGTGLGLRISKALAQLLGGEISVESEPGGGSTFTLRIRAVAASKEDMETEELATGSSVDGTFPLEGYRILLAEDGLDNQKLLSHFLTKAGASVQIANNGFEAVIAVEESIVKDELFDLVIMDTQMPEMDGHSATRELRGSGITVPILALTAHATQEAREAFFAAGCDGFATKPIDRRKLIESCVKLIGLQRRRAA